MKSKDIKIRSGSPVSFTLDFIGDKWSLLIIRDMIFEGKSSYGDFLNSDEKIATNILADRLNVLEINSFIAKRVSHENKSKFVYSLTEKGIALLPIIIEMIIWGSKFGAEGGNNDILKVLKTDKEKTIKEFTKILKKRIAAPIN